MNFFNKIFLGLMAGLLSLGAVAQETGTPAATVLASVQDGLTQGKSIAVAIVVGLFAIWAIKLLWRSK